MSVISAPFKWIVSIFTSVIAALTSCMGCEGGLMLKMQLQIQLNSYGTTLTDTLVTQTRGIIERRLDEADYDYKSNVITDTFNQYVLVIDFSFIGKAKVRAVEYICTQGYFYFDVYNGGKETVATNDDIIDVDVERISKNNYALEVEFSRELYHRLAADKGLNEVEIRVDNRMIATSYDYNREGEILIGSFETEAEAEAYAAVLSTPRLPVEFNMMFPEIP